MTDPKAEAPDEWIVSRVCEEFGCLPSQAVRELNDGDADLVFTIIELRSYVHAKRAIDHAAKQEDLKMTPAIAQALQIEEEIILEDMQRT